MKTPTRQQAQVLAFIRDYTTMHGCAPAEHEIERFFGTSPPSVHSMILRLEKAGFISRIPGAPRSIRLVIDPVSLSLLQARKL